MGRMEYVPCHGCHSMAPDLGHSRWKVDSPFLKVVGKEPRSFSGKMLVNFQTLLSPKSQSNMPNRAEASPIEKPDTSSFDFDFANVFF